jgi:hypothetical protein
MNIALAIYNLGKAEPCRGKFAMSCGVGFEYRLDFLKRCRGTLYDGREYT